MNPRVLALAVAYLTVLPGCTPGAAGNAGGSPAVSGATLVHVSLLRYAATSSQYGTLAGYSPNVITVARGATVQFVNDDTFPHTATSLGSSGFPSGNTLTTAALTASQPPTDISQPGWSTGQLDAGAFSQGFTASASGTYYFGCYFHYSTPNSPMRGVIVVQ